MNEKGYWPQSTGCYVPELTRINAILASLKVMFQVPTFFQTFRCSSRCVLYMPSIHHNLMRCVTSQKLHKNIAPTVPSALTDHLLNSRASLGSSIKAIQCIDQRYSVGICSAPSALDCHIKTKRPKAAETDSGLSSNIVSPLPESRLKLSSDLQSPKLQTSTEDIPELCTSDVAISKELTVPVLHQTCELEKKSDDGIEIELVSPEEMAILESAIQTAAVAHTRATAVRRAAATARSGRLWGMRSPFAVASEAGRHSGSTGRLGLSSPARTPIHQSHVRASSDSPSARRVYDIHSERWLPAQPSGNSPAIQTRPQKVGGTQAQISLPICSTQVETITPSMRADECKDSNISGSLGYASGEAVSESSNFAPHTSLSIFANWISPAFGNANSHRIVTAESSAARRPFSISREDLAEATVVGQTHNKFILCLCRNTGSEVSGTKFHGPLVLLVDQHAADERIRLEAMEDILLNFRCDHPIEKEDKHQRCRIQKNGISDVTVSRKGRNGVEIWEAVRTVLHPPTVVEGLDPSNRRLLQRYCYAVEAWGFQVQSVCRNNTYKFLSSGTLRSYILLGQIYGDDTIIGVFSYCNLCLD